MKSRKIRAMNENPTHRRPFKLIGELINHSFQRARHAWHHRDLAGYQRLAKLQTDLGADYLTVNIDGTQQLTVKPQEMLDLISDLIPAIQEVSDLPLAFDNPWIEFHRCCLAAYDGTRSGPPLFNSVAASRDHLEEMYELIGQYDANVIVMASERFVDEGSAQCFTPEDVHRTARTFVETLRSRANRTNNQIFLDPGLAPISADTYGLVNMGLDAMRLIRQDADLEGVHVSVGLTNFSFGVPKHIREGMENAYITLATEAGLDCVLGNPEKNLRLLDPDDRSLQVVRRALADGRPKDGESQEEAGFRQSARIMELYR